MKLPSRRTPSALTLFILSLLAGLLLSVAFFGLGRWLRSYLPVSLPGRLHGAELIPPRPAVDFTLAGSDHRTHTLDEFLGQVVLLYFGYSTCPEDCPAMLAKIAAARENLGTQRSQVQVLFITIDPQHDTPDRLAAMLAAYGEGFLGLTGDAAEIREIAANYDLLYAAASNGIIEHTPQVMLIDRSGFWRAVYPAPMTLEDITADLRQVLDKQAQVP
jgi:protein SCO1/2